MSFGGTASSDYVRYNYQCLTNGIISASRDNQIDSREHLVHRLTKRLNYNHQCTQSLEHDCYTVFLTREWPGKKETYRIFGRTSKETEWIYTALHKRLE